MPSLIKTEIVLLHSLHVNKLIAGNNLLHLISIFPQKNYESSKVGDGKPTIPLVVN